MDVSAMAEKIVLLAEDSVLRETLGEAAALKVRDRHDVSVGAPQVAQVIRQLIMDNRQRP